MHLVPDIASLSNSIYSLTDYYYTLVRRIYKYNGFIPFFSAVDYTTNFHDNTAENRNSISQVFISKKDLLCEMENAQ